MLKPSEHWYWTYSATQDRLLLEISTQARYCSPFRGAMLVLQPEKQPLSMAEAEAFWMIDDSLQQLDMPVETRLECCLAALASGFVQQQAHKSWYFQQGALCNARQFDVVVLRGLSSQYALITAAEDDSVNCLLLGELSTLSGKILPALQPVRVLRNRISALDINLPYRRRA